MPRAQSVHAAAGDADEYEPGGHGVHDVDEGAEYVPTGQLAHVACATAPLALEKVPGPHATQADCVCPGAALYVPAGHRAHPSSGVAAPATLP